MSLVVKHELSGIDSRKTTESLRLSVLVLESILLVNLKENLHIENLDHVLDDGRVDIVLGFNLLCLFNISISILQCHLLVEC